MTAHVMQKIFHSRWPKKQRARQAMAFAFALSMEVLPTAMMLFMVCAFPSFARTSHMLLQTKRLFYIYPNIILQSHGQEPSVPVNAIGSHS